MLELILISCSISLLFCSYILGVQIPDNEITKQLTGANRSQAIRRIFTHLIRGLLSKLKCPLVLFVDDIQWLDSGSNEFLSAAIDSSWMGCNVLIVASLKTDSAEAR